IFFIAEFLANRIAPWIGPRLYGLPYSYGRISYSLSASHDHRPIRGKVANPATGRQVEFQAAPPPAGVAFAPARLGTLDEFCLERYSAFTERKGVLRRFRIWHEPWLQVAIDAPVIDDRLLHDTGPWFAGAKRVAANLSPGVKNVWIGPPQTLRD
ncbi:MAG TPA: DUF2071 domain-containing protein, partial [Planctomycetota bacterium]|nr:DUF2071 domain-containing protein [Planctomycetota bacterium]